MVRSINVDSNQTVLDLRTAIEGQNLAAGRIERLQRVSFSLNDEAIDEKLQDFTFTPIANDWRPATKLSAVMPTNLARDHLHLIIRA
jgi:hypothetical protein